MHEIDKRDCQHGLADSSNSTEQEINSMEPVAIPWKDLVSGIWAVGEEASRRGEMYPQTSGEQREDRSAVRRVAELVEWYATSGGSVAESLPNWPKAHTAEQLATLQAKLLRVEESAANRLIGLCKCGEEREALQAKLEQVEKDKLELLWAIKKVRTPNGLSMLNLKEVDLAIAKYEVKK